MPVTSPLPQGTEDYLLTWNCKHIANAEIIRRLEQVIRNHGYLAPTICTPTELFGGQDHE